MDKQIQRMESNRLIEIVDRMEELQQEFFSELRILLTSENPFPSSTAKNELLTRQQVKDYLRISESTYIRKVKDGTLRPIRMPGGDRFYKIDLLQAFNESVRRGRI